MVVVGVPAAAVVRVRFQIIRNARIENVGESQSCMVSKLRIIWKQTVPAPGPLNPMCAGRSLRASRRQVPAAAGVLQLPRPLACESDSERILHTYNHA